MTLDEMKAIFEGYEGKRGKRPNDIDALLLLRDLVPCFSDLITSADHDQIWLYVDAEELAAVITEEQVKYLSDCGVFFDEDTDSLSMFV